MTDRNPTATLVARTKVRLGLEEKSCKTCKLFDRPAAQEVFSKQFPAFGAATQHLSPGQMVSAKRGDFDAEGQPVEALDAVTQSKQSWRWDQFGLCVKQKVVTHEDYWCGGPAKGKDEKDTWE